MRTQRRFVRCALLLFLVVGLFWAGVELRPQLPNLLAPERLVVDSVSFCEMNEQRVYIRSYCWNEGQLDVRVCREQLGLEEWRPSHCAFVYALFWDDSAGPTPCDVVAGIWIGGQARVAPTGLRTEEITFKLKPIDNAVWIQLGSDIPKWHTKKVRVPGRRFGPDAWRRYLR